MEASADTRKDFIGKEAVAKLKELIDHNAVCMFTSELDAVPMRTRPMTTQEIDDQGNFWFFSSKESHKNEQVDHDSRVQLLYANTSESEYLTVYGTATIVDDRKKIEKLYSPMVKAWFPGGKDDPNISLIKVTPENAYYWEPKYNKMETLFKMAASAVTGKGMNIGQEGELDI